MNDKITKSESEWMQQLSPEQYQITRLKGTERPFTGTHLHNKSRGTYHCVCCGEVLFHSDSKYDSGSGWPSFDAPHDAATVKTETDKSHGMIRVEVMCGKCDGHLGHVFEDGPAETTGLRYCINSASLQFSEEESEQE